MPIGQLSGFAGVIYSFLEYPSADTIRGDHGKRPRTRRQTAAPGAHEITAAVKAGATSWEAR